MATSVLTAADLDQLRRYNTPTISNAIELFEVRPRTLGFLPHQIRCLLPELGPIVGYAVTVATRAAVPEPGEPKARSAGRLPAVCGGNTGAQDRGGLGSRRAAGPGGPVR